ncbi:unnamed protein product [Rhizophagus irregularis]|nr:unnamed protein product [Rhizophagus irregularis]
MIHADHAFLSTSTWAFYSIAWRTSLHQMRFYFSLRFCKSYQKHSVERGLVNCRAIPSNSVKRFTSTDLTEIDYNTDFDPNVKKGTYRTENFY